METKIYKYDGAENRLFDKVNCNDFNTNSLFIVPETHVCLRVCDGIISNLYTAGKYNVFDTKKKLFSTKRLNDSVELIYLSKNARMEINWGTQELVDSYDDAHKISYKMGARGVIEVCIDNPKKFYLELVHVKDVYQTSDLAEKLRAYIVQVCLPRIIRYFRDNNLSYYDFMYKLEDITNELKPILDEMLVDEYGLTIKNMTLNIYIPDEDKEKLNEAYEEDNSNDDEVVEDSVNEEETKEETLVEA